VKRSNDVVCARKRDDRISRWVMLSLMMTLCFSILSFGSASAAPGKVFDHLQTGFPLIGAHTHVECESCHLQGVFRGTPRQCKGCHSSSGLVKASSKPSNHVPSSDNCGDCHKASTWVFARFSHLGVTAACVSCHNGRTAPGKGRGHPTTSNDCASCHRTRGWAGARYDHAGIADGCDRCHLKDLSQRHPTTSHACVSCHRYPSWSSLRMDHNAIAGARCSTCHDGRIAEGKSRNHVQTVSDCGTCHKANGWTGASVDHSLISFGCSSCHLNDKPNNHAATQPTCESCHRYPDWTRISMNHNAIGSSTCTFCHNGSIAQGKPRDHPSTSEDCGECHNTIRWN